MSEGKIPGTPYILIFSRSLNIHPRDIQSHSSSDDGAGVLHESVGQTRWSTQVGRTDVRVQESLFRDLTSARLSPIQLDLVEDAIVLRGPVRGHSAGGIKCLVPATDRGLRTRTVT